MRLLSAGFPPYGQGNFFQSHWQLTQRCNFHCPYCVNRHLRTEGVSMSPEIMIHALKLISGLDRSHFHFCLSGGEVTLYPHLGEMLDNIASLFPAGSTVTMMSNGSASASHMRELVFASPCIVSRFVITVHIGQTNVDRLIDKLHDFTEQERAKHFSLKIVTPPGDRQGSEIASRLREAGIRNFEMMPVLDFSTGLMAEGYTAEEMSRFMPENGKRPWFYFRHLTDNGSSDVTFLEGIDKKLFRYQGMFCSAGRQSIFLDELGNVSRGQFCGHMPYNIIEKNPFEDPVFMEPVRCPEDHCTCIPFTALPKWSEPAYAPVSCSGEDR